MSGIRGAANKGKIKLLVRVQRMDRSNRFFHTNVFVHIDSWKNELAGAVLLEDRINAKYDFPVCITGVHGMNQLRKAA